MRIEVGLAHAHEYFLSTWQLRFAGYMGDDWRNASAFPQLPETAAEEGIFSLPRFSSADDEPTTFAGASSRLLYGALNMLELDTGNPLYGNITAVFSPAFWPSVAVAPMDSGTWTLQCNKTYRHTPGAHPPVKLLHLGCASSSVTPGVAGHMDHALLNNERLWNGMFEDSPLAQYFRRWFGDSQAVRSVNLLQMITYLESNVLANAHYADRSVKMLVAKFSALFGSARGALLQQWAAASGVVLAWAYGDGRVGKPVWDELSAYGPYRAVDALVLKNLTDSGIRLSVNASAGSIPLFRTTLWQVTAAARQPGGLPRKAAAALWEDLLLALPAELQLTVPSAGACSDWTLCLGKSAAGTCACYF